MQALLRSRALRAPLALTALAVCGLASAATLQFDFSVASGTTTLNANPSVSRFDTSLGTLQSVTFGLSDSMTTTVWLSNQSASDASTITGTVTGNFTLSNGSTSLLADTLSAAQGAGDTFAVNPSKKTDFAGNYAKKYDPKTVSDSSFLTATKSDATTLAAFKGTSPISLAYNATAVGVTTSSNGNALAVYQTTALANGYVIYTYQPTPEPASCAALAVGAVSMLRRRKAGAR